MRALLAFLSLAACAAPAPPPDLPRAQAGWSVSRAAPVLPAGALRHKALWNDPSVMRTADGYTMYITTSVGAPFVPPILPFRATSRDGRRWALDPASPLLVPGGGPYASIETPSVVRFSGRWWMAFTGIYPDPHPTPMAIGIAVSPDGVQWRVDRWTLLKASGAASGWMGHLVGEPGLVVHDGRLLLYFSAVGAREGGGPPHQSIGLIISRDGAHWSAPQQVLVQGPLYPASGGYAGYASPAAISSKAGIDLFYSVAHVRQGADPEWQQVAIHHARSIDGLAPFHEDRAPVLTRASTDWTDGEILAPAPLLDGDRITLWFGGHVARSRLGPLLRRGVAGPEFGIGLATLARASTMKGTDR